MNGGSATEALQSRRLPSSAIEIRALRTDREREQCVALQRATWGADFRDVVPPSVLSVAERIGGVAAGAFTPDGEMVGFVFGMAGVLNGEPIHWSDMLAVRTDMRDRGIGRRLKEFQRRAARASGATTMYWTFDPLVARNAHVNFNRLGVTIDEYVEDMYGASNSVLHRGLGTDRLVVAWRIASDESVAAGQRADVAAPAEGGRVLNPDGCLTAAGTLAALAAFGESSPAIVRVEIPLDIIALRDKSPEDAARWRASTRQAFRWALARGYTVARFTTDAERGRGWYVMVRGEREKSA